MFSRLKAFLDDVKRIREALERLSPPNDARRKSSPLWYSNPPKGKS